MFDEFIHVAKKPYMFEEIISTDLTTLMIEQCYMNYDIYWMMNYDVYIKPKNLKIFINYSIIIYHLI